MNLFCEVVLHKIKTRCFLVNPQRDFFSKLLKIIKELPQNQHFLVFLCLVSIWICNKIKSVSSNFWLRAREKLN